MARLTGIFDEFSNLNQITAEDIIRWLKVKQNPFYTQNFLANRVYYPQAVPVNDQELEIDWAILREALIRNPHIFNQADKKIIVDEKFITRFPDMGKLATVFIDSFKFSEPVQLILERGSEQVVLGTIEPPKVTLKDKK
jgi:hypothetical protein